MKCLMRKSFVTNLSSVVILSLFLAGCGEEKEEPDPGEIINGLWTGSLISESTGDEKTFEAILSFSNLDILPPHFFDIMKKSPKITDTPGGVAGVFIIQSDAQVDTLISDSYRFSFEWPLVIFIRAGGSSPPKYRLTTSGIVNSPMMEGTYEEFGPRGEGNTIDSGTWSALRKEKLP